MSGCWFTWLPPRGAGCAPASFLFIHLFIFNFSVLVDVKHYMSFGMASFLFLLWGKTFLPRGLCTCCSPCLGGSASLPSSSHTGSVHLSASSGAGGGAGDDCGGKGRLGPETQGLPFGHADLRAEWTSWETSSRHLALSAWGRDEGLSWRQTSRHVCILQCRHLQDVLHSPPVRGGAAPLLIFKTWPG